MLLWIFQQIVISLVVIVLIHSIYKFLQNNLTTPKIRDLVNKPTKRYEEIYNTFKKEDNSQEETSESPDNSMKHELQNYLKELSSQGISKEVPIKMNETNIPEAMSFSDNNFSSSYETL